MNVERFFFIAENTLIIRQLLKFEVFLSVYVVWVFFPSFP